MPCVACPALLLALLTHQSNETVVVPFQFIHHEILATAYINNQGPYTVMLDTGTAPSVIDVAIAKKIGLKIDAESGEGSGGGTQQATVHTTSLPQFALQEFTATNVDALTTDLSGLSKALGFPIAAVMGDSLFSGRIVQFDYPHRVARFLQAFPPEMNSHPMRFKHEGSEIHLSEVRINGKAATGNLDTGSSGWFSLTPRGIKRLGLSKAASKAKAISGAGFNGSYTSREGRLKSVRVGGATALKPLVVYWQPGTGHDDRNWDVNIGNAFLEQYVVTIDYVHQLVSIDKPTSSKRNQ
jgi:predicted aspartyl protease